MTGASMNEIRNRSAEEVLQDHLRESRSGSVEEDLKRNYAEDVVLLTGRGLYRGHDGVRELNRMLAEELPNARFEYQTQLVHGEMGFLEWAAEADGARVEDGADSYFIRSGRVVVQTVHYKVQRDRSDA